MVQPFLYYVYEKYFMNKWCESKIYKELKKEDPDFKVNFDIKDAIKLQDAVNVKF